MCCVFFGLSCIIQGLGFPNSFSTFKFFGCGAPRRQGTTLAANPGPLQLGTNEIRRQGANGDTFGDGDQNRCEKFAKISPKFPRNYGEFYPKFRETFNGEKNSPKFPRNIPKTMGNFTQNFGKL